MVQQFTLASSEIYIMKYTFFFSCAKITSQLIYALSIIYFIPFPKRFALFIEWNFYKTNCNYRKLPSNRQSKCILRLPVTVFSPDQWFANLVGVIRAEYDSWKMKGLIITRRRSAKDGESIEMDGRDRLWWSSWSLRYMYTLQGGEWRKEMERDGQREKVRE